MTKPWPARFAAIAVLAVFIAIYTLQPGGLGLLTLVTDCLFAATAMAAAVLALRASSRFESGTPYRRAWLILGLGLALWAGAELLWANFQLSLGGGVPYPSPADLIWALGFVPLTIGLFLGHRSLGVRLSRRQRLAAVAAYALLLALLGVGWLRPLYFSQPAVPVVEAILGTTYLVGDLTLAFIATLSLLVLWDGVVGRPWLPIAIGMLLFAISDTVFAYADWSGRYAVGANLLSGLIDIAYLAAYLSIALGAFRQATLCLADAAEVRVARPSHP